MIKDKQRRNVIGKKKELDFLEKVADFPKMTGKVLKSYKEYGPFNYDKLTLKNQMKRKILESYERKFNYD